MNKRLLFSAIGALLFIIIASNLVIQAFLENDSKQIIAQSQHKRSSSAKAQSDETTRQKKKARELVVSDPAKYGIVVRPKASEPRTQLEWDVYIEQSIKERGLLDDKKANEAYREVAKTEEEYKARMEEVDKRIKMFEERKSLDPSDEQAERRLQKLYRLKAIGKALEEKLVKPPEVSSTPQNP